MVSKRRTTRGRNGWKTGKAAHEHVFTTSLWSSCASNHHASVFRGTNNTYAQQKPRSMPNLIRLASTTSQTSLVKSNANTPRSIEGVLTSGSEPQIRPYATCAPAYLQELCRCARGRLGTQHRGDHRGCRYGPGGQEVAVIAGRAGAAVLTATFVTNSDEQDRRRLDVDGCCLGPRRCCCRRRWSYRSPGPEQQRYLRKREVPKTEVHANDVRK